MPWTKVPGSRVEECDDDEIAVVKEDEDGEPILSEHEGCHDTEEDANDQIAALEASENSMSTATLEQKSYALEVKQVDDSDFEGHAAVFGNEDQGGDIIRQGAFSKTLQEQSAFPLQVDHNPTLGGNVGLVEATEDQKGLKVDGDLNTDTQAGREAKSRLEHFADSGAQIGMSIGFETVKSDFEGETRILQEIKLHEVTLTLFPMNQEAQVTNVTTKAAAIKRQILGDDDFLEQLAQKTRPLLDEPGTAEEPGDHSDGELRTELAKALASEL